MKIDITKMEGYREDMTAEEKLALYSSYEFTPDYTGYVKKDVFDKKASEAAELSRNLKSYKEKEMTDEQRRAEAEKAAKDAENEYKTKICSLEIGKIFAGAGLEEDDFPEIPTFTETDKATAFANSIVKLLSAKVIAAEQKAKTDLLGGGTPPASGAEANEAAQLKAEWAEAVKSGNMLKQVQLMTLAQSKKIDLT